MGTMGAAIPLRVSTATTRVADAVKQIGTPRSPDPIMRRPGADRDEKRLLRLQKTLATYELLIIDELGFVPQSRTGAELLFELISQRYERGATIITSNLPFDELTFARSFEPCMDGPLARALFDPLAFGRSRPCIRRLVCGQRCRAP